MEKVKIKVLVEWASDGTISVMMEKEMFSGIGESVEDAIENLKLGVALFIETAKEKGFPYKSYLDGDFEVELEYDAVSMLKYAREYIKDTKLAELTGISAQQLGRYANEVSKPRLEQRRRIVEALRKFAAPLYAITYKPKTITTMETIKISEIIDNAKKGVIPYSIKLMDASRYAANSTGEMIINTDIFYSGRVRAYLPDDELIEFGKKTLNVSELRRVLKQFMGLGEVRISTKDKMYQGEIKDE